MCVVILSFILDVRLVDVLARVTQEEGHTGFLHLPSVVLALIFLARRMQPFLSLVDRESRILCTNDFIVLHLWGILKYIYVVIPFILDVRLVDVPAGVTQEEGHTDFSSTFVLRRLP